MKKEVKISFNPNLLNISVDFSTKVEMLKTFLDNFGPNFYLYDDEVFFITPYYYHKVKILKEHLESGKLDFSKEAILNFSEGLKNECAN